ADGARNGSGGASCEERGTDGRLRDGVRNPTVERVPVAEEVFRAAFIFNESYTGVDFIERGLTT
ncbi:hypothetical protein U1Q18_006834, partial [Sarracenia purpurea var. burkii]